MGLLKRKRPTPEGASPQEMRLAELLHHHQIDCVFDIGANIGQTAQRYRTAGYTGRIVSFEPLSGNHAALCTLAKKDSKWDIAPRLALGAQAGETSIHVAQNHDMSSILAVNDAMLGALPKARAVTQETVRVETLDHIFDDYAKPGERVFIKVDTQGYEQSVVEGAVDAMRAGKIIGWQLELSFLPLYEGEPTFEILTALMKTHGYDPHFALQGYFSKKLMRQLQMDIVFFRT